MGGLGRIGCAKLVCWIFLPRYSVAVVLAGSTVTWLVPSVSIWLLREKIR